MDTHTDSLSRIGSFHEWLQNMNHNGIEPTFLQQLSEAEVQ